VFHGDSSSLKRSERIGENSVKLVHGDRFHEIAIDRFPRAEVVGFALRRCNDHYEISRNVSHSPSEADTSTVAQVPFEKRNLRTKGFERGEGGRDRADALADIPTHLKRVAHDEP
jgi:hypothetical protein